MKYRKDIQILRGIAVLFVVLFHLGVWGFNSGFLGVDIFFVISGYLMGVMYDPEKTSDFFAKRAKRLLPAYFATIFVSVLAAIFITAPVEYDQVATQAVFATFFSSNIGFWMDYSYWDNTAFRPLLHLWSLGVEIQFYLLVPLIYWFYKKIKFSVPIIALSSLILSIFTLGVSPKTVFYLLPFRVWQFLMGFMVAKYLSSRKREEKGAVSFAGGALFLLLLCIPLVKVDGTDWSFVSGHPGLAALVVSVATAGILWIGVPAWIENNLISTALEKLGKYSYSIYLAHFPVIVFYLYKPFSGTVTEAGSIGKTLLMALIIVFASMLLFYLIETPMRNNVHVRKWLIYAPIAILVFAPLGFQIQKTLISDNEMLIYQAWFDRSEYRCGKLNRFLHPLAADCELQPIAESPDLRILLVGDSHADAIKTTFTKVAESENAVVYFLVKNDPLYEGGMDPEQVMQIAKERNVDAIVLHYSPGGLPPSSFERLVELSTQNQIPLSFIMPVPTWDVNVPDALIKHLEIGQTVPLQTRDDYLRVRQNIINMVSGVRYDKFRVYSVVDSFCAPDCRLVLDNGKPLYFDNTHLTLSGSEVLGGVFTKLIDDLR